MPPAITGLFGIRHPIVLAPMGGVAGGRLAAAVSAAGGLGMIGTGYNDGAWIERQFDAAEGARVGIGFITWDLARSPDRLVTALTRAPAAVMLSFGDARPFLEPIRASGARVMLQVQTLEGAVEAAALGPDVIVAQGHEAGGHGGGRGLLPLLPAVVDRVAPIPVLAAGGIADGRGIVACQALGAAGVLVGTRFYAAEESLAAPAAKARAVAETGDHTVRTRVFDIVRRLPWPAHWTGRALRNGFTDRWHGEEKALGAVLDREQPRYAAAAEAGEFDTAAVWAGEGLDLVRDVAPAGMIVERFVREASAVREWIGRQG
ncbi:MAG TPA: nitronate monooxygenase [Gemmatimonadales bacterium]|nr:nitronate monooxygenase [Gemmatimonadales bacterium]